MFCDLGNRGDLRGSLSGNSVPKNNNKMVERKVRNSINFFFMMKIEKKLGMT